jgi:hypothetical protein
LTYIAISAILCTSIKNKKGIKKMEGNQPATPVGQEKPADLAAATAQETERADAASDQALAVLGEVAQGTPRPQVLANGEVQTQRDRDEELRVRREQGHSYQR